MKAHIGAVSETRVQHCAEIDLVHTADVTPGSVHDANGPPR
jgi:hypothetical protein